MAESKDKKLQKVLARLKAARGEMPKKHRKGAAAGTITTDLPKAWREVLAVCDGFEIHDIDALDGDSVGMDHVLAIDLRSEAEREAKGEMVRDALKQLDVEIESVRERANGYPANPISAAVWMDGAGYATLARALTFHFREAGWLAREENASLLWAKATMAVCGHYQHLVGPAMLASADCQDRVGNDERGTAMYSAVVRDFAMLVARRRKKWSRWGTTIGWRWNRCEPRVSDLCLAV